MEAFVRDSAPPWPMRTFFYSDVSRINAIAGSYPAWRPYTIRKCPSPQALIGVLDEIRSSHPRYWRNSTDDVGTFTAWVDHAVAFCLVMSSQIDPLQVDSDLRKLSSGRLCENRLNSVSFLLAGQVNM